MGDMEKTAVVYKRRPKKPLEEQCSNAADDHDDRSAQIPSVVSDKNGNRAECVPVEKATRKSWIDRSLSSKGRRSSLIRASSKAYQWVGTLFRSEGETQEKVADGTARDQPIKKHSAVSQMKKVKTPVEFVKEKQAMFAEIDSFELESEEESPAKPRTEEWIRDHLDASEEVSFHRSGLDSVSEDDYEECGNSLSAILRTPLPVLKQGGNCEEESSKSNSLQTGSSQPSSRSSSLSWSSKSRNTLSDSEDYSSPVTSFSIDESEFHNSMSNSQRNTHFSNACTSLDSPRENKKTLSPDGSLLISALKALMGEEAGGQSLNPLIEEDEEEHCEVIEEERRKALSPDGNLLISALKALMIEEDEDEEENCEVNAVGKTKETELFQQCRELPLETHAETPLPVFKALLEECGQSRPLRLRDAMSDFCDLSEMMKLGEGTFGEAFKGGGCVFKIVPMDGDFMVNGEVQKTSAEIYSEVILTNTLARLRSLDSKNSTKFANYCTNFIETKAIRICQGSYEVELCMAWEQWDALRASENDHPMRFPQNQLYVVFVLADGGQDLENFVLYSFEEARSLLLQVVLALAVAEEGCGFEHRDLHWGNIVLARDKGFQCGYYRLCNEELEVKTGGVSVSIIDFTLSRIDTGKEVFFCNLSADPALFEGPSRDTQAETYRRMLNLTKGNWEGSFPKTNCHWIHYVADVLVNKKSYKCDSRQKRALRSFCKRVLLYESAKAAVSDEFFHHLWIKGFETSG